MRRKTRENTSHLPPPPLLFPFLRLLLTSQLASSCHCRASRTAVSEGTIFLARSIPVSRLFLCQMFLLFLRSTSLWFEGCRLSLVTGVRLSCHSIALKRILPFLDPLMFSVTLLVQHTARNNTVIVCFFVFFTVNLG